MKQPIFKKNTPIDEARISYIEKIVSRLVRRSVKKITSLITPYPISNAVFGDDIKGPILYYMFPCKGSITKALICLGNKPKNEVIIDVSIKNQIYTDSKSYGMTGKSLSFELNKEIYSGDRLKISITPSEKDQITEVWVSFLWVPFVKEVEAKSYLISDLEESIPLENE